MITPASGVFWRSVFASDAPEVLRGARAPEGRYHHDRQAALYLSPNPQDSRSAIDSYLRPEDPPRVIIPLRVTGARLADLRDPATLARLGLQGHESATLWQPQRATGHPATSWIASDAARASGADGIIYAARSHPTRWHIVLFSWNRPGAPHVTPGGPPIAFAAPA